MEPRSNVDIRPINETDVPPRTAYPHQYLIFQLDTFEGGTSVTDRFSELDENERTALE